MTEDELRIRLSEAIYQNYRSLAKLHKDGIWWAKRFGLVFKVLMWFELVCGVGDIVFGHTIAAVITFLFVVFCACLTKDTESSVARHIAGLELANAGVARHSRPGPM